MRLPMAFAFAALAAFSPLDGITAPRPAPRALMTLYDAPGITRACDEGIARFPDTGRDRDGDKAIGSLPLAVGQQPDRNPARRRDALAGRFHDASLAAAQQHKTEPAESRADRKGGLPVGRTGLARPDDRDRHAARAAAFVLEPAHGVV